MDGHAFVSRCPGPSAAERQGACRSANGSSCRSFDPLRRHDMAPCGVWKQTSVPADKVDEVVEGFQFDDPTKIEKVDNKDGTFDVIATFPKCADGKTTNQTSTG